MFGRRLCKPRCRTAKNTIPGRCVGVSTTVVLATDVLTYSLLTSLHISFATRVHSALELSGRCALQIYLLTYLDKSTEL